MLYNIESDSVHVLCFPCIELRWRREIPDADRLFDNDKCIVDEFIYAQSTQVTKRVDKKSFSPLSRLKVLVISSTEQ